MQTNLEDRYGSLTYKEFIQLMSKYVSDCKSYIDNNTPPGELQAHAVFVLADNVAALHRTLASLQYGLMYDQLQRKEKCADGAKELEAQVRGLQAENEKLLVKNKELQEVISSSFDEQSKATFVMDLQGEVPAWSEGIVIQPYNLDGHVYDHRDDYTPSNKPRWDFSTWCAYQDSWKKQ